MDLDKIMHSNTHEELGAELGVLKEQMESMQKTLTDMQHGSVNNSDTDSNSSKGTDKEDSSELLKQIKHFREQTEKHQKESQHQLEGSVHEAMEALGRIQTQLQSNKILMEMDGLIEQAEKQLSSMNSDNPKESNNSIT